MSMLPKVFRVMMFYLYGASIQKMKDILSLLVLQMMYGGEEFQSLFSLSVLG